MASDDLQDLFGDEADDEDEAEEDAPSGSIFGDSGSSAPADGADEDDGAEMVWSSDGAEGTDPDGVAGTPTDATRSGEPRTGARADAPGPSDSSRADADAKDREPGATGSGSAGPDPSEPAPDSTAPEDAGSHRDASAAVRTAEADAGEPGLDSTVSEPAGTDAHEPTSDSTASAADHDHAGAGGSPLDSTVDRAAETAASEPTLDSTVSEPLDEDAHEPTLDSTVDEAAGADVATEGPSLDATIDDAAEPAAGGAPEAPPASQPASTDDGDATTGSSADSNRLPTGIDALDRAMGGGVPPGRLVLLVSDPGVQSELIVDSILAQRDTLYVTTDRPEWEVMKDIEPGLGSGEIQVRDHTPDSLLSGVESLLDELGTSWNFVLDSVNELELVPRPRYRLFLSDVKQRLFETGSVGLLTGVTVGHESARDLTLRRADIVLRLETRTSDHEIENRLSVPKFRGGAAMTETVKLELTDEVRVDESWGTR